MARFECLFRFFIFILILILIKREPLFIFNSQLLHSEKFDDFPVTLIELIAARMLGALTFLFNLDMTFAQVPFPYPLWHT